MGVYVRFSPWPRAFRANAFSCLCASRSPVSNVGLCVQDPALPLSCTVSKSQFWSSYRVNVTEVNPLGSSFSLLDIIAHSISKPRPLGEELPQKGRDSYLWAILI